MFFEPGTYGSAADLDAASRVRVVPVDSAAFRIDQSPWNSEASWYDPRLHRAAFILLPAVTPGCPPATARAWETAARNTFGLLNGSGRPDGGPFVPACGVFLFTID